AGPRRPQDRVAFGKGKESFDKELPNLLSKVKPKEGWPHICPRTTEGTESAPTSEAKTVATPAHTEAGKLLPGNETPELHHGSVVIAAITSCTNTSNPSVMLAAGLLAKKAVEKGLRSKPWVKTSLAPGSKVVTDYLVESGLMRYLEQLRFHLVGYGCTTCI